VFSTAKDGGSAGNAGAITSTLVCCTRGEFCSYKEMNSPLGEIVSVFISLYHYRHKSNHNYEGRGRPACDKIALLAQSSLNSKGHPKIIVPGAHGLRQTMK
jgi:hypothetical protein